MKHKIILKSYGYYINNKRYFNRYYNDKTKKYIHSYKVGNCTTLYRKYKPETYQEFADKYFNDYENNNFDLLKLNGDINYGRSVEQISLIAEKLFNELNDNKITIENCFDLMITHIVIETFVGQKVEELVRDYIIKNGKHKLILPNQYEDTECGIDIITQNLVNNKINFIQIKPISLFLSKQIGVITDRKKFHNKYPKLLKNLIKEKYSINEIHDTLLYIVYSVDNNGNITFLKDDNKRKPFLFTIQDLTNENGDVILKKENLKYSKFN